MLITLILASTLATSFQEDLAHEAGLDQRRPLEAMDLFRLEGISSPTVSPDGLRVLFTRIGFDVMKDRRRSELWLYDVERDDARPLIDGVGGAVWSPTGEHIAYVTGADDDGAEIFVRWMDDGTTRQCTRLEKSPGSLSWSPDGTRLAFTMAVERATESIASLPSTPKGADWAPRPKVVERFQYRGDGAGYLENVDRHIFVVDAMGGAPRQLTEGPFDHGGSLVWTGDTTLLFSANRRDDRRAHPNDSELWELDVRTKELRALTEREGPDGGAVFDAESGTIYWTGLDDMRQGHQQSEISVRPLEGGEARVLTAAFDRSPSDLHYDGGRLLFSYADRGETKLAAIDGEEIVDLGIKLHGVGSGRPYAGGSFDVAGGTLAFVGGDPVWPGELHVARSGEPRRVTDVNGDLKEIVRLGAVREITVASSADEREIQGWIITPPEGATMSGGDDEGDEDSEHTDNDDGARPMILEIHGGPFAAYGPQFTFELQLMAARGYVVLYGNPRGSTSYGADFANEIHHAYPSQDYDDLMSLVDGAIEQQAGTDDPIDESRLFVTGGSGGGVLTAWIVGKTDRFAAAVVAKPVINWISFALTADAYDFFWQYWFPGTPWDEPEHYWSRSPLSLIGNVSTPTMLLTGEQDFRTPISESEQYYQALKIRGVETAFVRIPEASHGIAARPSHLVAKVLYVLGWFEKERD